MNLFGIFACCLVGVSPSLPQAKTLTILHTNDLHAAFVPHEALWLREAPKPLVGGFIELHFVSDSIRKVKPDVLMLDAGDVMMGNPITESVYRGASGGALCEMMNLMGYDAWCIGNHDLDISQENLRAIIRIMKFPTLSANLVDMQNGFPFGHRPFVIIERAGLRIGVIGIISSALSKDVFQHNLVGIKVLSPVETMQRYIDELDPQTDLIIALTHEGVDDDSDLADHVEGLDIIVGGHTHSRLRRPKLVNGVIIVQAGSSAENLGELTVTVEGDRVTSYDGKLIPLWAIHPRPASPVSQIADSMGAIIDAEYSEVLATLDGNWMRKDGQSAIGTFIAEAQRTAAAADIGFMNNYGIRRDVAAGPLTRKTLFEVVPFRNILTTFQLTGRQLREIMEYNVTKRPAIQIAGMSGLWKRGLRGKVDFVTITAGGKPLDERRMYTCAASDYFVGESKRYLGLEIVQPLYLRQTVFEVVENALRKAKIVKEEMKYSIEKEE